MPLPIESILPQLKAALAESTEVVLQAPPGAGKTTLVPPALLHEKWLGGGRIMMLEPRRLAARAAARRISQLLGEEVGRTVGYRIRMDTRISRDTRIEVVTEGVLTRFLQNDPSLEGIGLLIFDEYHERSLQVDLGLALSLESKSILRPDLRILVMSATLEGSAVARLLGGAPVLESRGRKFDVDTSYLDRRSEMRIEDLAAQGVRRALAEHDEGDVLVFLPGAGEIRRVQERLPDLAVDVLPLHGSLPQQQQDAAITPADNGRRKVVLSTDIAETSLTIEGVRIVIDSGLTRVPRFSPRSGMTTLVTLPVSKASADQRRGRAGRLGPGVCYRLWSRLDQQHLEAYSPPEIANADLAPLALELARWGTSDPSDLRWLDPPPVAAFNQARELLRELGALDSTGAITDHGLDMVEMGLHPRLAHLVLSGITLGLGGLACEIAALLSERDIFHHGGGVLTVDLRPRLQALRDARSEQSHGSSYSRGFHLNAGAARRVSQLADHFRRKRGLGNSRDDDIEAAGLLLAFAYPDRIAQLKPGQEGRFRLRTGRSALLTEPQPISGSEFIVAAALDGRAAESRIFIAAPVAQEDLEDHFREHVDIVHRVYWENGVVRAREQHVIDALILKDGPLHDPDPDLILDALLDGIRSDGLEILPWSQKARRLQERLEFMHVSDPEWPSASDPCLLETLKDWLRPHLYGIKRIEELQRLDLTAILLSRLTWERRRELDERAPTHLEVPSGSKIPISYADPSSPVLAVRLQEMFGLTETPRIDRGRVPLTLHLLSPAHRPVQITQDLVSFWRDTYFDVRKDMRGRYPKHHWPENPLDAPPTNRAKPRP